MELQNELEELNINSDKMNEEEEEDLKQDTILEEQPIEPRIPLSTSILLNKIPKNSLNKLKDANEAVKTDKITIRFQPIGAVAPINPKIYKIGSHQSVSVLMKFLNKKINRKKANSPVFCYINNSFAPNPDENLGNLYDVSICSFLKEPLY